MNTPAQPPPCSWAPPTVVVLGVPFHNVDFRETVEWTRARIRSRRPGYIATANVDFVMQAQRDPELQRILLEADLVVADGNPIVWLSGWTGPRLKARVTGSDLVPMFAAMLAEEGGSLFNLGGAPGVAEKAAAALQARHPGLRVAGCFSPPKADVLDMCHEEILRRLDETRPDLLLVAFGSPKQEKWVHLHARTLTVPVSIGVGGSLDFLAGAQKRAPAFVQRLGMEWLWRMLSDPRRLFRRYAGNIVFYFSSLARLASARLGSDRPESPLDQAPEAAELRRLAHVERWEGLPGEAAAAGAFSRLASLPGHRPLVLDLAGAGWLSSLELGVLLRLTTAWRARGQVLLLLGAGQRVRRLLRMFRLTDYLELADSPASALATMATRDAAAREGRIALDARNRIEARLPLELTVANLDAFKAAWEAAPGRRDAAAWTIDASATRFVDSAAIGFLVGLRKRAAADAVAFRVTGVQDRVRQAFRIAKVEFLLQDLSGRPA